jgi:hypothetical protein
MNLSKEYLQTDPLFLNRIVEERCLEVLRIDTSNIWSTGKGCHNMFNSIELWMIYIVAMGFFHIREEGFIICHLYIDS